MEATSSRNELTAHLVELFKNTPSHDLPRITYLMQGKLRPDFEGVELGLAEKLVSRSIAKSAGTTVSDVNERLKKRGDLGDAAAGVLERRSQTTFASAEMTVERLYETLVKIADTSGPRSQETKSRHVSSMLNDATPVEGKYIVKLLLGIMRLGVAENTILDALAITYAGSKESKIELENAYNVSSDLGRVAGAVATGGIDAVRSFGIRLHSPIRPMLADRVRSPEEADVRLGKGFAAELKLDGERVQIHIGPDRTSIYSRRLEDIASYYPDIIKSVPGCLGADNAIIEAEAVAVKDGRFLPFQELMHRRRKHGVEEAVEKYPVSVNIFDILYLNGRDLMSEPYSERRKIMEGVVSSNDTVTCIPSSYVSGKELDGLMEDAFEAGAEGLMLKKLDSTYRAGSRGSNWLKLKREYREGMGDSLDLAVVGAFHGKGRRTGTYGALLLAVYDPDSGRYESICKVGTGFTDESLAEIYRLLEPMIRDRVDPAVDSGMEPDVWFKPSLVLEIGASEVSLSPTHRAGMGAVRKDYGFALRFPTFTGRFRHEKSPEQASTPSEAGSIYAAQNKTLAE